MDITIVTFIEKAVSNDVFFSQQKGFCQILVFHFPKKWVARAIRNETFLYGHGRATKYNFVETYFLL